VRLVGPKASAERKRDRIAEFARQGCFKRATRFIYIDPRSSTERDESTFEALYTH